MDGEKDWDLDLISCVEETKKTKKWKTSMRAAMAVSVAGRFFSAVLISIFLMGVGWGGVFEVEGGAGVGGGGGVIDGCCTATRGQPKRERDGVGGRRKSGGGGTAGLYLNTANLRDWKLQMSTPQPGALTCARTRTEIHTHTHTKQQQL